MSKPMGMVAVAGSGTNGVELATYPGLDERIVILRAGETVDAVLVRTARFDVLVDTLDTPKSCRDALDRLGVTLRDRPLIVVNSHMDWDHFWGNAAVAGHAPIIAHEKAAQRFRSPAVRQILHEKAQEDARFGGIELYAPTVTFSDKLRLEGGDLTLELFPTPGHTPDHIALWIPEIRVCLAVDAVESPIPEVWSDDPRDLRSLVASLRLIRSLDAAHVVLAHGQTSSPAVVDANLAYFETMAERVRRLGAGDASAESLKGAAGLDLWDLVTVPAGLSPEARTFYERCHASNLRATCRSRGVLGPDAASG